MNIENQILKEYGIDVDKLKTAEDYAEAAYEIATAPGLRWVSSCQRHIKFLFEKAKRDL